MNNVGNTCVSIKVPFKFHVEYYIQILILDYDISKT